MNPINQSVLNLSSESALFYGCLRPRETSETQNLSLGHERCNSACQMTSVCLSTFAAFLIKKKKKKKNAMNKKVETKIKNSVIYNLYRI